MTIPRFYPYRVIDGDFGRECLGGFLWEKKSEAISMARTVRRGSDTWKMWGTPFVKDLDVGGIFSWWKKKGKSIFSYVMISDDEWIEFISPKPEWKYHNKKSIRQLINYYLNR